MTEIETAVSILKDLQRPVVLELGAHYGVDTCVMYDACSDPVYIAVEPDPRVFQVLIEAVGSRNALLVEKAISDHVGEAVLHLCESESLASSSIRAPKEHLTCFPWITFERDLAVECLTLDALAEQQGLDYVDLIWSDLQGAERDMIAGGQRTLAMTKHLILECDRVEMYEGQITRDEIMGYLPDFELIDEWPDSANLYLRNRRLA